MNRMIRRFFPKGSDFSKLKQKDCNQVQDWLNDYPRPSLGGKTPRERCDQYEHTAQKLQRIANMISTRLLAEI